MKNPKPPEHAAPPPAEHRGALPARPIRLLLLRDAIDPDGAPRPALLLPALPAGRPTLRAFPTVAAALAAKRDMEAAQ